MKKNRFWLACIFISLSFHAVSFGQTWKAYDSIAQVKIKNNDLQGAVQAYTKAIGADSNNYFLYQERAKLKVRLKDFKGSITDFSILIKFSPDAGNYYQRGISYYMMGNYEEAMADFDATITMEPNISYELYFFRGNIKFKQLDFNGSIAEYTKSIELKPGYAKAWYNRGVSKYFGDQKNEACKDINKAKELGFTDVDPKIKQYCDYYNAH